MSQFKVGDKVRCTNANDMWHIKKGKCYDVIDFNDEFHIKISTSYDAHAYHVRRFELVTPNEKLIKREMELDEMKKIDKKVRDAANTEVLEEIENEQKVAIKAKLREIYDKKKNAEGKANEANSDLKELTKDLKSLTN